MSLSGLSISLRSMPQPPVYSYPMTEIDCAIFLMPEALQTEVHVWIIPLDAAEDKVAVCEATLSDDELARANRYRFARDRRRFVMARGYLRRILSNYLGIEAHSALFVYNFHGKPALSDLHNTAIEFNLSHSDELAVLAVTKNVRIGIDIEFGAALTDCRSLAERFFHADEVAELATLPENGYKQAFLNVWTRKEALMKAVGMGLSISLDDVVVSVLPTDQPRILRAPGDSSWTVYSLLPGAGYAASLVIEGAAPRILRIVDSQNLGALLECSTR